jgi:nitroreductase
MPLATKDLLQALSWRYATKQFEDQKAIPAETWAALEQVLVLSPSSYGLQPWKFIVVDDPALRTQLKAASWNQPQITDAARLVVFATQTTLTVADIDRFINHTAQVRGIPASALDAYKGMMVGDLVNGPRSKWVKDWAARQAYIALGILLESAALLGVDACPMEGFDPAAYDRILDLPDQGLTATVVATLGYRSAADKYASQTKVRYPLAELIEHR